MAVFRVERNTGYTVMSNHHLRNKELTLKAKGLLSQMLSLPEDWDYTLAGLSYINRESIDAIRTAVWELEKAGYITRRQGRDEKGKMTAIEYTIYEQPQSPGSHSPGLENPTPGKPILENPIPGNPTSENPTQLNKDISKTNLPKLALLPLLLLLILAQWVGIFLTTFSTVLTNLLAGLFFFVALACWIMKLADGGEVLKMLITAFVVFVLPYIAIAAIAKISFFAEELRDFLQS